MNDEAITSAADVVRRIPCATDAEALLTREWLVTNGLGGYASGTLCGVPTRRYHGLLIAALPAPLGRMMMLNHLSEQVRKPDGSIVRFGGQELVGGQLEWSDPGLLVEFRLEAGLPVWTYQIDRFTIEKRVFLAHELNIVHIMYQIVAGEGTLRLKLRPAVHFRSQDGAVNEPLADAYTLTAVNDRCELSSGAEGPHLRFLLRGQDRAFTIQGQRLSQILYRTEESRGYDSSGELWAPGYFRVDLALHTPATLTAATEPWETLELLTPREAHQAEIERRTHLLEHAGAHHQDPLHAELVLAADAFVIRPSRAEDAARARAAGDELRSVIAGYHWFTDWGRDSMISLEGLTLTTGRHNEAGFILRSFARYIRAGLIPNFFPDGNNEGVYHTADATLWFFHALDRHVDATGDRATLAQLLPALCDIIDHHMRGTRFGIGMDHGDKLLRQGQEGYQLTWMDAKVGDWVVTPRRGKAVEINGLWYNALCLLANWLRESSGEDRARPLTDLAEQVRESFNSRFWNAETGCLFDVIDGETGNDAACRPNQLLAFSLKHAVLEPSRWAAVLQKVHDLLLTPVGLRSLAPGHPDYKPRYFGDLRARDAAYHQGTVWAWLMGPFIDAWLRVHPADHVQARRFLEGFGPHLSEACIGSISEVFDAEAPFTPRGCIAQAWSVAEVLRCWVKTRAPAPLAA